MYCTVLSCLWLLGVTVCLLSAYSKGECVLGWSDLAFFSIFEYLHISVDQV